MTQPETDLKIRVREFWQRNPCGAKFVAAPLGSRDFFEHLERHRYLTEWHIPEVVDFPRWRGRDVLEVGCGLGTEAVNFVRAGARYTGIDLTEASIDLTRRRLEMEGLRGIVRVGDAEALPFGEGVFDLVYSHGVLHHTPDPERAVGEVYRVLRPCGTAMVMLYHRTSYNYYVNIMTLRRAGSRLLTFDWGPSLIHRLTGEGEDRLKDLQRLYRADRRRFLSPGEFLSRNTDGAGNPLSRVYTRTEAEAMFGGFSEVKSSLHFLNKRWLPLAGRWLPRSLERRIAGKLGWHLWIVAQR